MRKFEVMICSFCDIYASNVISGYFIKDLSISFFPPVCNFADYAITVGVAMLVIYIFFFSDSLRGKKDRLHD